MRIALQLVRCMAAWISYTYARCILRNISRKMKYKKKKNEKRLNCSSIFQRMNILNCALIAIHAIKLYTIFLKPEYNWIFMGNRVICFALYLQLPTGETNSSCKKDAF